MKILHLHGWQSVSGGVKRSYPAKQGHEIVEPELPDEDFGEASPIAQAEFVRMNPGVVVGPSPVVYGKKGQNHYSGQKPGSNSSASE